MRRSRAFALPGALVALVFTTAAVPAPAQTQCAATFAPESVTVQETPVEVEYTLSAPIGTVADATTQDMSGLDVVGHDGAERRISLDTSTAAEGEWEITFHGDDEATCTGRLTVRAGA